MINQFSRANLYRLIVLVGLLFLILPFCLSRYGNAYAIPAYTASDQTAIISNINVLLDELPPGAVADVIQSIKTHGQQTAENNVVPYAVKGAVTTLDGDYNFTLLPATGSDVLHVIVTISNNYGLMSVTTQINPNTSGSNEPSQ